MCLKHKSKLITALVNCLLKFEEQILQILSISVGKVYFYKLMFNNVLGFQCPSLFNDLLCSKLNANLKSQFTEHHAMLCRAMSVCKFLSMNISNILKCTTEQKK